MQVLLDLVKAFERISHKLLVQEGEALGYPMWMLRLSIATYQLHRVIRVNTVITSSLVAQRGI